MTLDELWEAINDVMMGLAIVVVLSTVAFAVYGLGWTLVKAVGW